MDFEWLLRAKPVWREIAQGVLFTPATSWRKATKPKKKRISLVSFCSRAAREVRSVSWRRKSTTRLTVQETLTHQSFYTHATDEISEGGTLSQIVAQENCYNLRYREIKVPLNL